jgi:cysteinyl-tRNA synthetase
MVIFVTILFPPCGSGRYTCTKIGNRHQYTQGETIHRTIQKQYKHTEYTKYKTDIQKEKHIIFLKTIGRIITK